MYRIIYRGERYKSQMSCADIHPSSLCSHTYCYIYKYQEKRQRIGNEMPSFESSNFKLTKGPKGTVKDYNNDI